MPLWPFLDPCPSLSRTHTHTCAYTHNFDNAVLIVSVCPGILMCHSNVFSSASFPLTAIYHNKQHKCLFHCSSPLLLMQIAFAWNPVASRALPVLRNTWQFMRLHTLRLQFGPRPKYWKRMELPLLLEMNPTCPVHRLGPSTSRVVIHITTGVMWWHVGLVVKKKAQLNCNTK